MDPVTMAIVSALASAVAGAGVGAVMPKKGMTQPGQIQDLTPPDTTGGFSRLMEGMKQQRPRNEITIQDLQRQVGGF